MKIQILVNFSAAPDGGSYQDEVAYQASETPIDVPDDLAQVFIAKGLAAAAPAAPASKKEKVSGSSVATPEN